MVRALTTCEKALSLHGEEGTTVVCSPSQLSDLGNGKRTKLKGQEKKSVRSSSTIYTKAESAQVLELTHHLTMTTTHSAARIRKEKVTEGRRQRQSLNEWERIT